MLVTNLFLEEKTNNTKFTLFINENPKEKETDKILNEDEE